MSALVIKLKPHVDYFNKKNLCTFLYFKDKQFFYDRRLRIHEKRLCATNDVTKWRVRKTKTQKTPFISKTNDCNINSNCKIYFTIYFLLFLNKTRGTCTQSVLFRQRLANRESNFPYIIINM